MSETKINTSYTDTEVIEKILSGETELFEILIRRYNPYLHKTGRSYGYNHADTQDIMQETFINCYMNLAKFEGRASFKTWIIRIMLNNCYGKNKKLSNKNEKPDLIHEKSIPMFSNTNTDTGRSVINRELNHIIETSLEQIPLKYRMVFSLREINGLNVEETAAVLNESESNVKTMLSRAKEMLRKKIEESYAPEDIFDFNLVYCDAMVENVMNEIQKIRP
jgi:RNA polymerase sigma-70 factor (ECF subfamily)